MVHVFFSGLHIVSTDRAGCYGTVMAWTRKQISKAAETYSHDVTNKQTNSLFSPFFALSLCLLSLGRCPWLLSLIVVPDRYPWLLSLIVVPLSSCQDLPDGGAASATMKVLCTP